jgi:tryptophan synthase alpha chain
MGESLAKGKPRTLVPTIAPVGNAPGHSISEPLGELRRSGRRGLIPYVCGGHPTRGVTSLVLPALERAGASAVLVRIPSADSFADSPAMSSAIEETLSMGTSPSSIMNEVKSLREWLKVGLVAVASVGTAIRLGGPDRFSGMLAASGFDGVVYADLPFESSSEWLRAAEQAGLLSTLVLTPATAPKRAEAMLKECRGCAWIACDARVGVPNVSGMVKKLREMTDLPVLVSGAIASASHVRSVVRSGDSSGADAAIVGDELIRRMGDAKASGKDPVHAAEALMGELNAGLSGRHVDADVQSQQQAIQQSA